MRPDCAPRATKRSPSHSSSSIASRIRSAVRDQWSGLVGQAELAGQAGELAQLQDEERGQVGGLDDAFGVEGGGVVPAAVVAVLVVRQRAGRGRGGRSSQKTVQRASRR